MSDSRDGRPTERGVQPVRRTGAQCVVWDPEERERNGHVGQMPYHK